MLDLLPDAGAKSQKFCLRTGLCVVGGLIEIDFELLISLM